MSVTTAVNINQRSLKIKLSGLDLENESTVWSESRPQKVAANFTFQRPTFSNENRKQRHKEILQRALKRTGSLKITLQKKYSKA